MQSTFLRAADANPLSRCYFFCHFFDLLPYMLDMMHIFGFQCRRFVRNLAAALCILIFILWVVSSHGSLLFRGLVQGTRDSASTHNSTVAAIVSNTAIIPSPQKYFHEAAFDAHYDVRFGLKPLSYESRRKHLSSLAQTYLSTMNELGIDTWLMHGSLLGWFWNERILPWDHDVDVQVSERGMRVLCDQHNMTIHRKKPSGENTTERDYLLDINPNWSNADITDVNNKIDARWVDMKVGLYVDITVLRHDKDKKAEGAKDTMTCKDRHKYEFGDIFPLRESIFEGEKARVPSKYSTVLAEEYGQTSLKNKDYENHRFDQSNNEWVKKLE